MSVVDDVLSTKALMSPTFPFNVSVKDGDGNVAQLSIAADGKITGDLEAAQQVLVKMTGITSFEVALLAVAIRAQLLEIEPRVATPEPCNHAWAPFAGGWSGPNPPTHGCTKCGRTEIWSTKPAGG